jgi:hypothetical protein
MKVSRLGCFVGGRCTGADGIDLLLSTIIGAGFLNSHLGIPEIFIPKYDWKSSVW